MKQLLRLAPYVRRHRGRLAAGLLMVLLATAATVFVPLILKYVIDLLEAASQGKVDRKEAESAIVLCAGAVVAFAAVRMILLFLGRSFILTTARQVEYELRNDLYAHLTRLPATFYDRNTTGDLSSRAINDIEGVRMLVGIGVMSIVGTGLMFVGSLAGMFALDWKLASISLVPLLLVSVVTAATGPGIHRRSLEVQDQLSLLSSRAHENFTGARVVRAFVQEEHEVARYGQECDAYLRKNLALARWRGMAMALIVFLTEFAVAVTLYVGGSSIIDGRFTKGHFVAFTAYQFMLVWPMVAIGWVITVAQRGAACMGRINEVLDTPPAPSQGRPGPGRLLGAIEFRDVSFRYAPDRMPALQNVSFRVAPGAKVAVVGRTGSGKSTIASLLLRFYDVPRGTVFIDGRDINDIPVEELRRAIGCVPQDPFLFSDTLRENIAFGSVNGPSGVERAAKLARLSADADRFPHRLDQMIGERGVTLSGGQKQRTAIARALVREPAILILDDALSSVDAHTEREILQELRDVMKGRTTLVITHRLSAVRDADLILVLEDGRLVETGTHNELVALQGRYAGLWTRQQLMAELNHGD